MALKAIIEKLDDAPEALREHYRAGTADEGAEGKFVLGVEAVGGFALEDVSGLKTTLGKEMTARKALEKTAKAFEGLDVEKARAAIAKVEELGNIDPAKEADKLANTKFEAAKAQLLEKHAGEIKTREDRIATLTGAVDGLTRKQQATLAIAEAKGAVELLLPHVLAHTRVKETDSGEFVVEVVDKDGNARIGDGKGTPMDIKGLVAEMRASDTFGRAFDADGHDGTGKKQDSPPGQAKGDIGGNRSERAAHFAKKFNLPAN